ncbi:MAG: hypothetical protein A2V72_00995 [Candidatus Nealsonbacteria bacterium RBG_13_37_56]|uniref:YdbS-like PH domain-containing protein n=1 Tax=Candidatus Nealsonbacteria bacterium RBG_13_37_56 TaxID=1801661 RepID=A0A1G2DXG1_9BACT|nr:MAG: hypothetical protein A2V72_00995 [Candidatus Nealsonbacteria bacterium RBG_13_37_56]
MQKLNPKAVWIFFFRFLLSGVFIGFFLAMFIFPMMMGLVFDKNAPLEHLKPQAEVILSSWFLFILLYFLLIAVFCWIWAKLTYRFYAYQLTEDVFKKECGVIWKKYVSIPYERIQNVDIHRGVIARILGLSDLYIQTAGASAVVYGRRMAGIGAEGYLPGLSMDITEQLREELIKKAKGAKQGL